MLSIHFLAHGANDPRIHRYTMQSLFQFHVNNDERSIDEIQEQIDKPLEERISSHKLTNTGISYSIDQVIRVDHPSLDKIQPIWNQFKALAMGLLISSSLCGVGIIAWGAKRVVSLIEAGLGQEALVSLAMNVLTVALGVIGCGMLASFAIQRGKQASDQIALLSKGNNGISKLIANYRKEVLKGEILVDNTRLIPFIPDPRSLFTTNEGRVIFEEWIKNIESNSEQFELDIFFFQQFDRMIEFLDSKKKSQVSQALNNLIEVTNTLMMDYSPETIESRYQKEVQQLRESLIHDIPLEENPLKDQFLQLFDQKVAAPFSRSIFHQQALKRIYCKTLKEALKASPLEEAILVIDQNKFEERYLSYILRFQFVICFHQFFQSISDKNIPGMTMGWIKNRFSKIGDSYPFKELILTTVPSVKEDVS